MRTSHENDRLFADVEAGVDRERDRNLTVPGPQPHSAGGLTLRLLRRIVKIDPYQADSIA